MAKTATMRYRRGTVEDDEQEIQALEKERSGVKEEEAEPEGAEEQTFKKRYGDIRRHLQKKEEDHRSELMQIRGQLESLTRTQVRLPKTDAEIDEWSQQYPDVAKVVETIATKKAQESTKNIEERLKHINDKEREVNRREAEATLAQKHPDFDDLRQDASFHEWAEQQPKMIQQALYENEDDPLAAAKAIDLYKLETGKLEQKSKFSDDDAALSVSTKRRVREPTGDKKAKWSESRVRKLSGSDWDKHSDEISEAISSGNFAYDESGAAR
tara:strand:- start:203 stop:1012 length:810 start_codon:yes stop_codon:yes gene_type:complete